MAISRSKFKQLFIGTAEVKSAVAIDSREITVSRGRFPANGVTAVVQSFEMTAAVVGRCTIQGGSEHKLDLMDIAFPSLLVLPDSNRHLRQLKVPRELDAGLKGFDTIDVAPASRISGSVIPKTGWHS